VIFAGVLRRAVYSPRVLTGRLISQRGIDLFLNGICVGRQMQAFTCISLDENSSSRTVAA